MRNQYGSVVVFSDVRAGFPRYALAEADYDRDRSGYFALGGFGVSNHNGVILAPSLFLRAVSKDRLTRKAALSWATDIKQWVRFVEAVQTQGQKVPYEFDLMSIDEAMLKRFGDLLTRLTVSREGKRLTTATVRNKLMRVCTMQQWFSDNGWYHGDLGPRAERSSKSFSIQPMGLLAHIYQRRQEAKAGPMGSKFVQSVASRRPQKLPRALTQADQEAVEKVLKNWLETEPANSPRYDQHIRDQLIFNTGRFVGLRVENMIDLPVAKVLALYLDGMSDTDQVPLQMIGKGRKTITIPFSVALLRQMQIYAETARQRAVSRGGRKDVAGLFVAHVGSHTGKSLSTRGIQKAMEGLFIQAGLSTLVPLRKKGRDIVKNERGDPIYRRASRFSVHDLRHTCAARFFYANLFATQDREQAMRAVQAQLCHVHIETTEKEYTELTRQFSTWKTFSEGLAMQRIAYSASRDGDIFEEFQ